MKGSRRGGRKNGKGKMEERALRKEGEGWVEGGEGEEGERGREKSRRRGR